MGPNTCRLLRLPSDFSSVPSGQVFGPSGADGFLTVDLREGSVFVLLEASHREEPCQRGPRGQFLLSSKPPSPASPSGAFLVPLTTPLRFVFVSV